VFRYLIVVSRSLLHHSVDILLILLEFVVFFIFLIFEEISIFLILE